jgi:hypothetical protein
LVILNFYFLILIVKDGEAEEIQKGFQAAIRANEHYTKCRGW